MTIDPRAPRLPPLALGRPAPRRARGRGRRPPDRSVDLLLRRCAGGVWKTTDGGTYWENVSDGFFETAAVGAHRRRPVAAERDLRRHRRGVHPRQRVARRRRLSLRRRRPHLAAPRARRHAPHRPHARPPARTPTSSTSRRSATPGARTAERGVFRSRNGGATWEHVLFSSERAGAVDLLDGPAQPARALRRGVAGAAHAVEHDERRPGLGALASPPTAATPGPTSAGTRGCRRACSAGSAWPSPPADGRRVYARGRGRGRRAVPVRRRRRDLAAAPARRRASAAGPGTTCTSSPTRATPTPSGSPTTRCWKSIDGGKTFGEVATPHGDNHDLWIDPREPAAHDRGQRRRRVRHVQRRRSRGRRSTTSRPRSSTTCAPTTRSRTGSMARSRTTGRSACRASRIAAPSPLTDWVQPGGGESGLHRGQAGRPEHRGRRLDRQRARHGPADPLRPPHRAGAHDQRVARGLRHGHPAGRAPLPVPVDVPGLLLALGPDASCGSPATASSARWTRGRAGRWSAPTSPATIPTKLGPPAGRSRATTPAPRCTARSSRSSSRRTSATCCGRAPTTASSTSRATAGSTWQPVTPPELPEWSLVSVLSSPRRTTPAPATSRPRATSSTTLGPTSSRPPTSAARGSASATAYPHGEITRVVREDPIRRGLLYCGTETGVWVSLDDGGSWERLRRESAGDADPRPDRQGRRSRRGHPRAVVLDPRRPLAPPPDGGGDRRLRGAPLRAAAEHPLAGVPGARREPRAQSRGRVPYGRLRRLRLSPDRVADGREARAEARRRREPAERGDRPLLAARGASGRPRRWRSSTRTGARSDRSRAGGARRCRMARRRRRGGARSCPGRPGHPRGRPLRRGPAAGKSRRPPPMLPPVWATRSRARRRTPAPTVSSGTCAVRMR